MNTKKFLLIILVCSISSIILSMHGIDNLFYHALNGGFWGIVIGAMYLNE